MIREKAPVAYNNSKRNTVHRSSTSLGYNSFVFLTNNAETSLTRSTARCQVQAWGFDGKSHITCFAISPHGIMASIGAITHS
jgi:hypothetical protein